MYSTILKCSGQDDHITSEERFYVPKAVLGIGGDVGREPVQRAQAIRHDEFVTILKLRDDALNVDVGALLGKVATGGVCDLVHGGFGFYRGARSGDRRRSSFLQGHISLTHLPTLRDLGVKVNGGRDEVDMGSDMLGDGIVMAADVELAGGMLVHVELSLQQAFGLGDGGVEGQPSHGL